MDRRVLLGAGAAAVVAVAALAYVTTSRPGGGSASGCSVDQVLGYVMPAGTALHHAAPDYNLLTSTCTVRDLSATLPDGALLTADTFTLSSPDPRALHDVFDPSGYPNGKPAWTERRLLLSDASANGVHLKMAGAAQAVLAMRSLVLHRLSGRPFALPPTPANRALPSFAADAGLAFAVDSVTGTDLAIDNTQPQQPGQKPFTMSVGSLRASDYDGGKVSAVAAKDLVLRVPPVQNRAKLDATVDQVDLKDADAHGLLAAVQQTNEAIQGGKAGFTYSSADISGVAVHVQDGPVVTLHDLHAEQTLPDSAGARTGSATLTGLTFAQGQQPVPPAAAAGFAAFGMTAITLDIAATSKRQAGGQSELAEDVTLHDLGKLHLKVAFTAGTLPLQPGVTGAVVALLSNTVNSASLVWDDGSLTERLFKVAAAQQHSTPDLVRAQLAIPLVALGVLVPNQPDAADQVTAFLDHPHTLTLTLNPPQPITLGAAVRAPVTDRARLLGLHIAGK